MASEKNSLPCPCCGDGMGAIGDVEGLFYDGQDLNCGCVGHVMLDAETAPYINADGCPCGDPDALRDDWRVRGEALARLREQLDTVSDFGIRARKGMLAAECERDELLRMISENHGVIRETHAEGVVDKHIEWSEPYEELQAERDELRATIERVREVLGEYHPQPVHRCGRYACDGCRVIAALKEDDRE